jgi:uncharacterized protein (DUF486 family)
MLARCAAHINSNTVIVILSPWIALIVEYLLTANFNRIQVDFPYNDPLFITAMHVPTKKLRSFVHFTQFDSNALPFRS